MIEEGESHVQARAEYHRRLSEIQQQELQGNQLITSNEGHSDSDEFQDAIDGFASSSDEEDEETKE